MYAYILREINVRSRVLLLLYQIYHHLLNSFITANCIKRVVCVPYRYLFLCMQLRELWHPLLNVWATHFNRWRTGDRTEELETTLGLLPPPPFSAFLQTLLHNYFYKLTQGFHVYRMNVNEVCKYKSCVQTFKVPFFIAAKYGWMFAITNYTTCNLQVA